MELREASLEGNSLHFALEQAASLAGHSPRTGASANQDARHLPPAPAPGGAMRFSARCKASPLSAGEGGGASRGPPQPGAPGRTRADPVGTERGSRRRS